MRSIVLRASLALGLGLAPAALPAQAVLGTVTDSRTGAPVASAVVSLYDTTGQRHDAGLSDANGRYAVRAPAAGSYVVRVERVGYATAASPVLALEAGRQASHAVSLTPAVVTLDAVVARGLPRQCSVRPENGAQAAVVWEEARKALQAAEVGARRRRYHFRVRLFRRALGVGPGARADSSSSLLEGVSGQPFRATPLERLAANGYVEPDGDSLVFHAPDAPTLLSDAFLDHHCFSLRLGQGPNRGLVGLSFAPLRGRRLADVRGTLWLERRTGHLRFIEYFYTGLPYIRSGNEVGGRIDFAQLGDGGWIVSRWAIRMPVLVMTASELYPQIEELVESGGEILEIRTASGAPVTLGTAP